MHLAVPQPVSTLYVDVARRRSELSRLQVRSDLQPLKHDPEKRIPVFRKDLALIGPRATPSPLCPCSRKHEIQVACSFLSQETGSKSRAQAATENAGPAITIARIVIVAIICAIIGFLLPTWRPSAPNNPRTIGSMLAAGRE
jgi:hypothetical protein